MKHLSNWIEIPVTNMDRARAFYQKILKEDLPPVMELAGNQYSLCLMTNFRRGVAGSPKHRPSPASEV